MINSSEMQRIVADKKTVSDKIRALNAEGFARADIARFLNKRYQHVRNVLEGDRPKNALSGTALQGSDFSGKNASSGYVAPPTPHAGGLQEGTASFESGSQSLQPREATRIGNLYHLKVDADGAVRLPKAVLDAFGLRAGLAVVADLHGETFTLMSPRESMERARAMVPQWRPGETMWSEELIADRRKEGAAEDRDV